MSLKYRISAIGWYNFEVLVQTLLKVIVGPGVTAFGGSKDGGRDASFAGKAPFPSPKTQWKGRWLFQVKYLDFEEQGTTQTRNALKQTFRKEISVVLKRGRHPHNYILITDVPLTARTRDDLENIAHSSGFRGHFVSVDGKEVCQFLDIYPDIRRAYPQLLGLADLELLINRDLYTRSQAYVQQWQPRLATYVQTGAHIRALVVLKHSHFLVLDGPPEARKTTIAAALVLTHAVEGFEVIDIRHPTEVFKSYEPNRRQIFVADDAVGSVSLEPALADSWSRDLPGILGKLDTEHKLIWTTRRYILEEALAESRLADTIAHFPGTHDVLVEVGSLTTTEKAEILYNHAKNANLFAASKVLIRQKASTIVYHRNFTPERIRQLITIVLAPPDGHQGSRSNVWDDIADFLSNPTTRWIQAYRKLSNSEQTLLSAMLDFAYNACSVDLKASYTRRSARIVGGQLQFDECCSRLQHSFLSTSIAFNGEHLISFQHPSLRDLLLMELRDDTAARQRYIQLASPFGVASMIKGIARSDQEIDEKHAVVPRGEQELSLLIDRIKELASGVTQMSDWEQLLAAAESLLPRTQHRDSEYPGLVSLGIRPSELLSARRQKPSEIDLLAFGSSWTGRIVAAIVHSFASPKTFKRNSRGGYPLDSGSPNM